MEFYNVIQSLIDFKKRDLAIEVVKVFEQNSSNYDQFDKLAEICFNIKEYDLGIQIAGKALQVSETTDMITAARTNLINLYSNSNQHDKALDLISVNELALPNDYNTLSAKVFSLYMINKKQEAEDVLRILLNFPNITQSQQSKLLFNLGTYELIKDNLLYGLELFLLEGKNIGVWKNPPLPGEQWIGQPLNGRTIFIISEAGIGDEIINVRFIKHLKEQGAIPLLYTTRSDLEKIFKRNGINTTSNLRDYSPDMLWCYSMTLPLYLKCNYNNLWYGSYLNPDQDMVKKYQFFKELPGKKIGLRWQGFAGYEQDLNRTLPLDELMNILPDHNTYISLQKEEGLDQLFNFPSIIDSSSHLSSYEDTLGIIENLDYVITSCTSVAHASAAMGKKTLILVPIASYYTWCHSTKQSPWYGDNVVLFRQKNFKSWKEPIEELKEYLIANDLI